MESIAVVGAGIVGLSTAHLLADQDYKVTIYTKDRVENTTSMKAAAIWFPYKVAPFDRVITWSKETWYYYEDVAEEQPDCGVRWVDFRIMDTPQQAEAWLSAVPTEAWKVLPRNDLPAGYEHGYIVNVPLIDTSIYMPHLVQSFLQKGKVVYTEINSLEDLTYMYDHVVNCTGLEARNLVDDRDLYPIRGQIVKLKSQANIHPMADDHGPNALAYIIPRSDGIICGGTAQKGNDDTSPDLGENSAILQRCRRMQPTLGNEIIQTIVGLRPGRSEVRLEDELDTNIIHNYGHGGSGFTLCWGCAYDVLAILQE